MPINFIALNGKHPFLDYQKLEDSFKNQFSKHCSEATVYIFNQFPVLISPETNIDFLIIIAIENTKGNFISFKFGDNWTYLHNLIIPIKLVSEFKEDFIEAEGDSLLINNTFVDFSKELSSMKFGLNSYLRKRCGFKDEFYIHPAIFVQNESHKIIGDHLMNQSFHFGLIADWIKASEKDILISHQPWYNNYSSIDQGVNEIMEKASADSIVGYLTKKKIDKIGKEISRQSDLSKNLGEKTIIIKGKAGSGKTTELIELCMLGVKSGYNPYFLTYNHLLVFDIAQITNTLSKNLEMENFISFKTLQGFFYDLSKKLKVLHVMTDERIKNLLHTLRGRMRSVYDFLRPYYINSDQIDFDQLKSALQNSALDKGLVNEGIDFVNYLRIHKVDSEKKLNKYSTRFFEMKKNILETIEENDMFLSDYYEVLKNTLSAIQKPDVFFDEFDLTDKGHVFAPSGRMSDKSYYLDSNGKLDKTKFSEFKNRRIGGRRGKNRLVFIDEGQDCHWLEKEILAEVYGSNNLIVAHGGKEQLIRHMELCNWQFINGSKNDAAIKNKRNKSFRIKPQIADFCNFLGKVYDIELDIEGLDTTDVGEVIIDFRSQLSEEESSELFELFLKKGTINGAKNYESLLVLLHYLHSKETGVAYPQGSESVHINEYDNVTSDRYKSQRMWGPKEKLSTDGYDFFDATTADKRELGLPYPDQIRLIKYESCRGLESWSVACFDLDAFFETKQNEEEAEKFLLDQEKGSNIQNMFITNIQRKKMYAATWVLMALTRAIDTVYIQVKDQNSEIGQLLKKYIEQNPGDLKVITSGNVNEVDEQG